HTHTHTHAHAHTHTHTHTQIYTCTHTDTHTLNTLACGRAHRLHQSLCERFLYLHVGSRKGSAQTFVGAGHPFEIIGEGGLAANQVREYTDLWREHADTNSHARL